MGTIQIDEKELGELIAERNHLRSQVAWLQTRGTELTEQVRNESITCMVSEFHYKFGYPVRPFPIEPPVEEEVRFRAWLITEEYFEAMEALFGPCVEAAHKMVRSLIGYGALGSTSTFRAARADIRLDLPKFADALADVDYVVEGTRLTFGIPRVLVARAVQEANMAKQAAFGNEPGKPAKAVKPEGWTPPDIAGVLRAHGWEPSVWAGISVPA